LFFQSDDGGHRERTQIGRQVVANHVRPLLSIFATQGASLSMSLLESAQNHTPTREPVKNQTRVFDGKNRFPPECATYPIITEVPLSPARSGGRFDYYLDGKTFARARLPHATSKKSDHLSLLHFPLLVHIHINQTGPRHAGTKHWSHE